MLNILYLCNNSLSHLQFKIVCRLRHRLRNSCRCIARFRLGHRTDWQSMWNVSRYRRQCHESEGNLEYEMSLFVDHHQLG